MYSNNYKKIKKPTLTESMYSADFVLSITRERNSKSSSVKILKNRYDGQTGKADPTTTINICARMISMSIFGDRLKLFRVDLENAIKKTIIEKIGDAYDPFHRESSGDGIE